MNITTNYNLPQWEAKDRVTRESVNDAMSSIDSALAAGASPWVKVAEATLDADAEPATFTFDAFDASDYALLLVPEIRSTSGNERLGFFLNGRNGRVNTDGEFGNAACSTRPIGSLTFITPVGGISFLLYRADRCGEYLNFSVAALFLQRNERHQQHRGRQQHRHGTGGQPHSHLRAEKVKKRRKKAPEGAFFVVCQGRGSG